MIRGMNWTRILFVLLMVSQSVESKASIIPELDQKIHDPSARIAFENDGGMLGGGVCWWHSRLQRAFWYLASFDPVLPRPSELQVRKLIQALVRRNQKVVIPGFADVQSFTEAYQEVIQRQLDLWQIRDGFINQAWVRGLSGRAILDPIKMQRHMDALYSKFLKASRHAEILWVMLQMEGITSHSSLLTSMVPVDGGYDLEMVDSNFPDTFVKYQFRSGQGVIKPVSPANLESAYGPIVPYAGFHRDWVRMEKAATSNAMEIN
jgi:hypothetical protein